MSYSGFEKEVLESLNEIKVDMGKRLAVLERHDQEAYGNGQPGWKKEHDGRLSSLELSRGRAAGFQSAVALFWTGALGLFEYVMHKK